MYLHVHYRAATKDDRLPKQKEYHDYKVHIKTVLKYMYIRVENAL